MNKFLAVLFAVLFTVSFGAFAGTQYRNRDNPSPEYVKEGPLNDSLAATSPYMFPYMPKDAYATKERTLYFCNKDGQVVYSYNQQTRRYSTDDRNIRNIQNGRNCYFYTSKSVGSEGSLWRVAYGLKGATHIFRKLKPENEHSWELWAEFDEESRVVTYTSAEARSFANSGQGYARLKTEPGQQDNRENQQASRQQNGAPNVNDAIRSGTELLKKGGLGSIFK